LSILIVEASSTGQSGTVPVQDGEDAGDIHAVDTVVATIIIAADVALITTNTDAIVPGTPTMTTDIQIEAESLTTTPPIAVKTAILAR
jgi:hypothetical protein